MSLVPVELLTDLSNNATTTPVIHLFAVA